MKKRIHSIVGHYGSGKTEFSVNYALDLKKMIEKVAIIDMDIANPYFRSRERQKLMEDQGIKVYFNTYGFDITEDLPAITATVRAPLENKDYITVVDVGGNDSGARIIKQFEKYFKEEDARMLAVLNLNRPETDEVETCIEHIRSIETETGIMIDGIINNTHMLRETTVEDMIYGYQECVKVSQELGIPVVYNTCETKFLDELLKETAEMGIRTKVVDIPNGIDSDGDEGVMYIYPLTLQMRPTWLDR